MAAKKVSPKARKAATPAAIVARKKALRPPTPWEIWKVKPGAIDALCEEISGGGNLNTFCKERSIPHMNMRGWIERDPQRAGMYARSQEDRADVLADEIVAIADELTVEVKHEGENVTLDVSATAVARNRLRVDARKWAASKLRPRTYGDKLEVAATVTVSLADMLKGLAEGAVPAHAALPATPKNHD